MSEMLEGYVLTRRKLRALRTLNTDKAEREIIGGMISDCNYTIDWLRSGRRPGNRRGIERRSMEQRTFPIDPLYLQSYAQPAACGSPTTLSDSERFRIDEALHTLSEREKQAFIFHVALGFSLAQTAQEMGTSKSTVQKFIERARNKVEDNKASNLFLLG